MRPADCAGRCVSLDTVFPIQHWSGRWNGSRFNGWMKGFAGTRGPETMCLSRGGAPVTPSGKSSFHRVTKLFSRKFAVRPSGRWAMPEGGRLVVDCHARACTARCLVLAYNAFHWCWMFHPISPGPGKGEPGFMRWLAMVLAVTMLASMATVTMAKDASTTKSVKGAFERMDGDTLSPIQHERWPEGRDTSVVTNKDTKVTIDLGKPKPWRTLTQKFM